MPLQPVPLFKRAASHFQPGDRQRGEEYFAEGRVQLEVQGQRARAKVAGAERPFYRVGVDWSRVASDRVLHAFCECQRFADGRPCKHLWAALLALGETGDENQPPGKDRVSLRKDPPGAWRDLGLTPGENGLGLDRTRQGRGHRRRRDRGVPPGQVPLAGAAAWRAQLAAVREEVGALQTAAAAAAAHPRPPAGPVRLLVNITASQGNGLLLDVFARDPGAGDGARWKPSSVGADELEEALRLPGLLTALPPEPPRRQPRGRRGAIKAAQPRVQRLRVPPSLYPQLLPALSQRGILGWWDGRTVGERPGLQWDAGQPWHLALRVGLTGSGAARLSGALEREGETVSLASAAAVLAGGAPHRPRYGGNGGNGGSAGAANGSSNGVEHGLAVFNGTLAPVVAAAPDLVWLELLREAGEVVIPHEDLEEALARLLEIPALPRLELPEELQLSEDRAAPRPRLVLEPDPAPAWMNPPLLASLFFDYGGVSVPAGDPRPAVVDWQGRRLIRRHMDLEHRALVRLLELGLKPVVSAQGHGLELAPRDLPGVAEPLLAEGWDVEVHGRSLRPPSPPSLRIESGIDWFEVKGGVDFAGEGVDMAKLLAAVQRGDRFVQLGDGSQGVIPAAWMETYDSLAKLAQSSTDDSLRFLPSQALLVDALLVATPPHSVDGAFRELRERLLSFEAITAKKEPKGFVGTLRAYQQEGLGWLTFLREFGLGGVLADDMGLGKTVQVLALLQASRAPTKAERQPSLVVAPRSLVYNWIDEAKRFTPKLKVLEYAGAEREELRKKLADHDLVVTTYGTLRRDIGYLATVEFDTVILDEAQAIKNAASQSAKASRLLVAKHRLALTGTPIENHIGELGSLFEFLNPGLLGRLPVLDVLNSGRAPSQQELQLVARGMRPFILRRTKAQVLPDLPAKTEQVLYTELRPEQREIYDQLRHAYQASLLKQVEKHGLGSSTMQVLEALLRLRQVACHPGLIDEKFEAAGSAKLEALFEQVSEVVDEGHKVLVFSQFTSLLAYVRKELDARGIEYAYLDGSTRDRAAVVERFQGDASVKIFLISLKAGGVGLNLTAAGYVYLLDPWWNPAVEAQAIDRAHRIGQTQAVFAYRLIARDTVEEKMLELQKSKKQLAEAILEGEATPLSELTADDLRMLLS